MNVTFADFCGFGQSGKDTEWRQLRNLLRRLSVYLKQSDQAGKVGRYSVTGCGTDFLQCKWAEMDRAAGEVAA